MGVSGQRYAPAMKIVQYYSTKFFVTEASPAIFVELRKYK
jgi:hypothetical protein